MAEFYVIQKTSGIIPLYPLSMEDIEYLDIVDIEYQIKHIYKIPKTIFIQLIDCEVQYLSDGNENISEYYDRILYYLNDGKIYIPVNNLHVIIDNINEIVNDDICKFYIKQFISKYKYDVRQEKLNKLLAE